MPELVTQLWEEYIAKYNISRHIEGFESSELEKTFTALHDLLGAQVLHTAFENNQFFASRSIAMLDHKREAGMDLESICTAISTELPLPAIQAAFSARPRDTIIALSIIENIGTSTFQDLYHQLQENFTSFDEDFIHKPVDSILGFMYALRTPQFSHFLKKNDLHLRPSEVFGLSYEKYPELKTFTIADSIKQSVDQAYSFFYRDSGTIQVINIAQDTAEQLVRMGGTWQEPGEINWVGVRPWRSCMQKCTYCDVWDDKDFIKAEIVLEKMGYVIDEVTRDGKKGKILSISGGEALLFSGKQKHLASLDAKERIEISDIDGLLSLVRFGKERGMYVSINTTLVPVGWSKRSNAVSLMGDELAEQLVASGVDTLNVSLESHLPSVHDQTTRLDGSWDYTKLGIRQVEMYEKRLGKDIRLVLNHVLTRHNFRQLPELIGFVGENLHGVDDINPLPVKDATNSSLFLTIDEIKEYYETVLPQVQRLAREYGFSLTANKSKEIYGISVSEIQLASRGIYSVWRPGMECYTSKVSAYVDYAGKLSACSYNADAKLGEFVIGSVLEMPEVSLKEIRARKLDFLNSLPCGELCEQHCGPDMQFLNDKIYMAIMAQDRRNSPRT